MSEAQNAVSVEQKPSFGKKVVGFAIKGGLVVGFVYFIGGLQDEQKNKFLASYKAEQIESCDGNQQCLAGVEANFDDCADANIESHRRGKFNRDYTMDEQYFALCMAIAKVVGGETELGVALSTGE